MPFGSYEGSKEQAFASAARVMKETGCGAIKVEGGRRMAETIAFLVERGVPVMGHVGLDAAGDQHDRLVSRPGPRRERLGADRGGCARGRGCRRLRGRARGDRRAARPPHHRRRSRSRPSASAPASPATARSWCSRTCSACRRGCRNSSSASASSGPSIERAVKSYAEEVRARSFPGPDHVYPMRKPKP